MNHSKIKMTIAFFIIFLVSGFVSCTKNSDETADKMVKEADMTAVSSEDINETDEDLLNVDYREFYDELAPHGEWIEVKGSEIGVDLKKGSTSGNSRRSISFGELFGIKNAHADDVSFGAFFVWKPAPGLAVGIAAGEEQVYYPYTNGQWVYTNNGWYFRAASQHEELTHHYGRWVYTPAMGWLWVPGRVWAPAWVEWREEDEYVAWAPVPPSVYIVNNVIIAPPVYEERYVIVERRYFIEPDVYQYTYKSNKHRVKITEWRRIDGITVVNKTIVNKGPDVTVIQSATGRTFEPIVINHVTGKDRIKYTDREFDVYSPEFRKVKKEVKVKGPVSKPKEFTDFHSATQKESGRVNRNERSDENVNNNKKNEYKPNENSNVPENPGKERKYIDDRNMKNGNEKGNKNRNNSGDVNTKQNGPKTNDDKGKDKKKEKGNKKYRNDTYKKDGSNNDKVNEKQKKQDNVWKNSEKHKSKGRK